MYNHTKRHKNVKQSKIIKAANKQTNKQAKTHNNK